MTEAAETGNLDRHVGGRNRNVDADEWLLLRRFVRAVPDIRADRAGSRRCWDGCGTEVQFEEMFSICKNRLAGRGIDSPMTAYCLSAINYRG